MFEKFQMAVRNAYLDLKNEGRLHFDREWPSPGELKSWCLTCLVQGLNTDDKLVFMRFFNSEQTAADLADLIESFDLDKLRPLRNFISGETQRRPDEKIVKLLAVLIDFKPRPYNASHWKESTYTDNLNQSEGNPTTEKFPPVSPISDIETEPNVSDEEKALIESGTADKPKSSLKEWMNGIPKAKTLLYTGGGLTLLTLFFVVYKIITPADCMCWNGVRYVEVDCQDKGQPYQIIGLDQNKLAHFQKITRPDTLTYEDIGQVWYSKINNEVEFFTHPGHHPVQHGRSLKAATRHIIVRYAIPSSPNSQNATPSPYP